MNLQTKQRVRRSHWKPMVTTELIIDVMNFFDDKKRPDVQIDVPSTTEQEIVIQEPLQPEQEMPQNEPAVVESTPEEAQMIAEPDDNEEEPPELVDAPDDSEDEDDEDEEEEPEPEAEEGIASRTRKKTGNK